MVASHTGSNLVATPMTPFLQPLYDYITCSGEDLKLFLHCADGDLDAAKRLLFNYYSIRISAFDSLFKHRSIDSEPLSNIRSLL